MAPPGLEPPTRRMRRVAPLALLALASLATPAPRAAAAQAAQPVRKDAPADGVVPGVEVLLSDSLHLLRGKRVGLVTNHSGRDRAGRSTIDILHRAPGVRLVALFAPEHGIRGAAEAGVRIATAVDSATGVPVYSLYGERHVPSAEQLRDVDVLVYDIQDVGARVYTYEWTMALVADSSDRPFVVLDRPNPVRADRVDGGVLQPGYESFVGQHQVAMRYGFTPGELLRWLHGTGRVRAPSVAVVPMKGYRRAMWWEDTRLPWVNPSPNLRDAEALVLYTGTVYFEGTNLSEGRGTDIPFKAAGAPWLTDAGEIARALNARRLPGVRFDSTSRPVAAGQKHGGLTIPMVRVTVTDRDAVSPPAVGLWMLREIHARHRDDWQWRVQHVDRLAGSDRVRRAVEAGDDAVAALLRAFEEESRAFQEATRRFYIYR